MDSTVTPTVTPSVTSADDITADHGVIESSATTPASADELLIEEISIDGMCGVY
ncbi:MAG: mycofactocin precursor MftA [Actinomycetota bacterium]|nr:mycofactocin precursor MftA [Actinomycetota bacterium]MDA2970730.1 mycofactocin precursor MftA [Actinomycetota bacterium]MDA3000658.1 mycofactocin precursor MftA [Actinomycetota bacterium]